MFARLWNYFQPREDPDARNERLIREGHILRSQKKFAEAFEKYREAGELPLAITCLEKDGRSAQPVYAHLCNEVYENAIEAGRDHQAKKMKLLLGEYHSTRGEWQEALDAYSFDESISTAKKCLKILIRELGDYHQACVLLRRLIDESSDLTRFSVPGYQLLMIICYLANEDVVSAKKVLEECVNCPFGEELIQHFENNDGDGFLSAVSTYDRIHSLDDLQVAVLLKIKKSIYTENGLC